jgi:hypothetical protein
MLKFNRFVFGGGLLTLGMLASVARINDFVFGNGTSMNVSPTMPPIPCAK